MRPLKRMSFSPYTLRQDGEAYDQNMSNIREWRARRDGAKFNFPAQYWREPDVLGFLYSMHGRSCAYCQGSLTHSDRGDVEHFRPKDVYFWLAYEFTNYLLSCRRCNSSHKGAKFPLAGRERPLTFLQRKRLAKEKRLLIDPVEDPIDNCFKIKIKEGHYYICARDDGQFPAAFRERMEKTIEFFKLNDDSLLLIERREAINKALKAVERAIMGDGGSIVELAGMANRYAPHGIIVRRILASKYPQFLPNPDDELHWLVDQFLDELTLSNEILQKNAGNEDAKKLQRQSCWALAALWREPPFSTPNKVKMWIQVAGQLGRIQPYYDQL
jgi:uncharacterized protein (TIGR02646 family)